MAGPVLVTTAGQSPPPTPQDDAAPGSMLASLRAYAAAERRTKHLDVPVAGRELLVVQYGYLGLEAMDRYSELQPGQIKATSLTMDMLTSACRTVFYRHDGKLEDLEVGLDGRLWSVLGWPLPRGIERAEDVPAPDVVLELFDGNGMALVAHAERVITWMQNPDALGEGSAATTE